MIDVIIAGPAAQGKTTIGKRIAYELGTEPVLITSMATALSEVMLTLDKRYASNRVTIVFDGIINSPREAIVAKQIVESARRRFAFCDINAVYIDNGTNFVLTDRTIPLG